jgi:putative transcriptional regulator
MSQTAEGKILIATPHVTGKIFNQSVIYIHTDDDTGAVGVMLNVPMDYDMAVKWSQELGWEYPEKIYLGGPCERRLGYVIHTADYCQDTSIMLNDEIAYTGGKHIMTDIHYGIGPAKFLLVTGYSAWQPQQLSAEIERGLWMVADFDVDYFFHGLGREAGWKHSVNVAARNATAKLLDTVDSV